MRCDQNDLAALSLSDIGKIDVLKDLAKTVVFCSDAQNGVIYIQSKKFDEKSLRKPTFNTKTFMPLGYQLPVEFYSPKYDTPEARSDSTPDLRSTIFWKPNAVPNSSGKVALDFYTADSPSTYSAVIEGITFDGKLIYRKADSIIKVK